jgi:very-short-patch-repair endonuclease
MGKMRTNCPYCCNQKICKDGSNSFATLYPDLISEWDKLNKLSPYKISPNSSKIVKWICGKNPVHKWAATINNRTAKNNPRGCPYCAGKKIAEDFSNSLAILRPDLKMEWDESNDITAFNVTVNSGKIVKWICSKNPVHKWKTMISHRTTKNNPTGCPYCSNRKIAKDGSNSLAILRPEFIDEWCKENIITPYEISVKSNKKIIWKCEKEHKWEARICDRTRKDGKDTGCPICKESKGEKFIKNFLLENNIEFTTQYKISYNECKKLRIDFYLEKYNTFIEFDGIQHFEEISYFGDENDFAVRIRNDIYKNKYCEKNNITLMRIHYMDINDTKQLKNLIKEIDIENNKLIVSKNYPLNWI